MSRYTDSLYDIIVSYLPDDFTKYLEKSQEIKISHQQLSFDYLSYCNSVSSNAIYKILSAGTSLGYNKFILQEEFYNILIGKCLKFKYLDMETIKHQIFYFSLARSRLESLCELRCDSSIESSYFYGLARISSNIQRLIVINKDMDVNHGIVKLIDYQNNLRYFEWKDNSNDVYIAEDPYEELLHTLERKVNTLSHLIMSIRFDDDYQHLYLQEVLPKFTKLKTLVINNILGYNDVNSELVYGDLEVFKTNYISLQKASSIIKNSGVYENCPLVERLSILVSYSDQHLLELENLLKSSKNLKSLLVILGVERTSYEQMLEKGDALLKILLKYAPTNLREIRFFDSYKFSLENLEKFFGGWKRRPALTIITSDPIYRMEGYSRLVSKYKNLGVIKEFRCDSDNAIYF
ncbi:11092_t:CDS:2 [Rhizophagus irregularis]|nr:11092_t:CDS:2 [Rhizophagus irregularis]